MSLRMRKQVWFPTRSGTSRPVQSQKQARSLKFRIYEEEEFAIYEASYLRKRGICYL